MTKVKLEQQTIKVVKSMFYRKTFDITLLDRYFLEKEIDTSLVISLYKYIAKNIWTNTFLFTDVFDEAFEKIVSKFLLYYPSININSLKYELDETNKNVVVFSNEFTQKLFNMWIKKER